MTYDSLKLEMGRRPVTIVEITVPSCSRTYGVLPCTAAIGVSGLKKCFNTHWTCQDRNNYDGSVDVTYRFATERIDGLQAAGDLPTVPCLESVDFTPTRLDPGRGLGIRSSVAIKLRDFIWNDVGTDPYLADRTYDPEIQGSFFGRLYARLQYLENLPVVIYSGFLETDGTYNAGNFIARRYLTDRWEGPSKDGSIVIHAKDPLKAADKLRAQIPLPSEATIQADITALAVTLQLGVGEAAAYSLSQPWVRIGDEVMEVTVIDLILDQLTVTRGTLPPIYPASAMVAVDHKAGATVQQCHYFDGERVDELVRQLLEDWASIDSSYIPFVDWQAEADDWFVSYLFSALIVEPTGVDTLLEEISKHNVLLWWDERVQEFKFKALQPFPGRGIPVYSDQNNIVAESVAVSKDPRSRVSQVWVYYAQRNPVAGLEDLEGYASTQVIADLDAESNLQYGEKQITVIYSRWITSAGLGIALEVAGRYLAEYRDTKTLIKLDLDIKDDSRWTGDQVILQTRHYQNDEGYSDPQPFLIIEAKESSGIPKRHTLTMQATRNKGRCAIISPSPWPDYLAATEDERYYGFITTALGRMSNGDPGYVIC